MVWQKKDGVYSPLTYLPGLHISLVGSCKDYPGQNILTVDVPEVNHPFINLYFLDALCGRTTSMMQTRNINVNIMVLSVAFPSDLCPQYMEGRLLVKNKKYPILNVGMIV